MPSPMAKKKWYTVTKGLYPAPGIFTSWIETAPLVKGVSGAIFESFYTEEEATAAYSRARRAGKLECVDGPTPTRSLPVPAPRPPAPGYYRSRSASTSTASSGSPRPASRTSRIGRAYSEHINPPGSGEAASSTTAAQDYRSSQTDAVSIRPSLTGSRVSSHPTPSPPSGVAVYVDDDLGSASHMLSTRSPTSAQTSRYSREAGPTTRTPSPLNEVSPTHLPHVIDSDGSDDELEGLSVLDLEEDLYLNLPAPLAQVSSPASAPLQQAQHRPSGSQPATPSEAASGRLAVQPCSCQCHRQTLICCCCHSPQQSPPFVSSFAFSQPVRATYSSRADPRSPLRPGTEVPIGSPSFGRPSPVYASLTHEMSTLVIHGSR